MEYDNTITCGIIPILFDWKTQEKRALLVTRHIATVDNNKSSGEEVLSIV